jgi:hypothetical protein
LPQFNPDVEEVALPLEVAEWRAAVGNTDALPTRPAAGDGAAILEDDVMSRTIGDAVRAPCRAVRA